MASEPNVHVVPDIIRSGWIVLRGVRKVSHHDTHDAAIRTARKHARRTHVDLIAWDRYGRIRSRESYANGDATAAMPRPRAA